MKLNSFEKSRPNISLILHKQPKHKPDHQAEIILLRDGTQLQLRFEAPDRIRLKRLD